MPQMIIWMMLKKFLPKIVGVFVLMLLGITASIWFLDGWSAFFSSIGVIILSILSIPVMIILGLVKLLNVGKQFKQFLTKKRTKQEFFSDIIQSAGMYFMNQQMGAMFDGNNDEKQSKKNKNKDIVDVNDKSVSEQTSANVLGMNAAAGAGALGGTALMTANQDVDEDPMAAMMEMLSNPEVQAQMQEMMMGLSTQANGQNGEIDISMLMGALMVDDAPLEVAPKNNVEDVEIKKIEKN